MPRQEKLKKTQEPGKLRKSASNDGEEKKRRKPRFKPETLSKRAVARAQKETCQYIPYATFDRIAHQVLAQQDSKSVGRFSKDAVKALWTESEAMLVDVFRASNVIRSTAKRVRLTDAHIQSALHSADIVNRTDYWRRVWNRPAGTLPPHVTETTTPLEEQQKQQLQSMVVMKPVGTLQTLAEMKSTARTAQKKASALAQVDATVSEKRSLLDLARAEEKRVADLKQRQHEQRVEQAKRAAEQRQRSLQPIVTDVVRIMQKNINK